MKTISKFAVVTLLAGLPVTAQAATISMATVTNANQTNASDPIFLVVDTDTVTDGTASAGNAFAGNQAVQNADGTSLVSAQTGSGGFGGPSGTTKVTSEAVWQTTETNMFGEARDYTLDFVLEDLATVLRTTRNYGSDFVNPFNVAADDITSSAFTSASFQYTINVNGVDVYEARADVLGKTVFDPVTFDRSQEYVFDNVENFVASISQDQNDTEFYNFTVADLSDTISLGEFASGADINITSTLTAIAQSTAFEGENGVGAFSADPISLSSIGNIQSTPVNTNVSAVPLPAAGWLLLVSFGGLAAMKRRKTV